jgi:hypothetical protein
VTVNVTGAGISFQGFPARVGGGLQTNLNQDGFPIPLGALLGATDHGGVTIHLVSSNPDVLRLSTDGLGAGSATIDVAVNDGENTGLFWIEGMSGATGTVTITASSPGFSDVTTTVDVVQPRVQLIGLPPFTTVLTPETPFGVATGLVHPSGGFLMLQGVRAQTVFTMTNSAALVAHLRTASEAAQSVAVTVPKDGYTSPLDVASGGVAFVPVAPGSTNVSATSPGFDSFFGSIDVLVTTPVITMQGLPVKIGAGLQTNFNPLCCLVGALLQTPTVGEITMRITSTNPAVALVSPDHTTAGAEFIDVIVPAGQTLAPFYVQGVAGTTGVVSFTASAPGFQPGAGTVEVVQPAVQIGNLSTSMASTDSSQPFVVMVGVPDSSASVIAHLQGVRAGSTLTATVTNSNAAVAQLVTLQGGQQVRTVTIPAGEFSSAQTLAGGGIQFDALTAGQTTVTAAIAGFLTTTAGTIAVDITGGSAAAREHLGSIDPVSEGFVLGSLTGSAAANDLGSGLNAWRVFTTDAGNGYYATALTATERQNAMTRGWKLTARMRVETGVAYTNVDFQGVGPRFDIALFLDAAGDTVVRLVTSGSPYAGLDYTLAGSGSSYHLYELVFDPATQTADLFVDGIERISDYAGFNFFPIGAMYFGAVPLGGPTGVSYHNLARLEIF